MYVLRTQFERWFNWAVRHDNNCVAVGYIVSVGRPPTTISFTKFALTLTFVNFSFRFPEDTLVGGDKETRHFVFVWRLRIYSTK